MGALSTGVCEMGWEVALVLLLLLILAPYRLLLRPAAMASRRGAPPLLAAGTECMLPARDIAERRTLLVCKQQRL